MKESFRRVTSSYPWLSPVAGRPAAGQAPGRKRTCWSSRCPPSAGSPARRATSQSQISSLSYHRFRPQMQGRCHEIYFRGGKLYCEFYQSKYTIRVLASFFEQCEKSNQFGRYRGYSMGGLSVKDALQVLPPLKRGGGSYHCPKYLLISSHIPGSTRMFISLGLLSAPALGILQICKKNLDLGLSEHPLLSKISAPHRRIIQARTKHQLLSTNFGLFIHVMTYSFISGAYVKPQKKW